MKRNAIIYLSALITVFSTGCSTLIHGTSDTVTINSTEDETTIYVNSAPRGKNAATVDLKRGEDYVIRTSKKGCQDVMTPVTATFDPTSLLGILIDFGIITIPIDLISGAAWKFSPRTYTLTPICSNAA